jgi:hypothetical protein
MRNIFLLLLLCIVITAQAQPDYFYPQAKSFNAQIPTPEQFLGYAIGSHHTRHDKVLEYFKTLDQLSDRVTLLEIGKSYEQRTQITAIITSPAKTFTTQYFESIQ